MSDNPKQYSRCVFDPMLPEGVENQYPMDIEHLFIYFGEIPNMEGHCVVMDYATGEFYSGYHIEHFKELTDELEEKMWNDGSI